MSRFDGSVVGTHKIVDAGASSERWDLVVLSDGFRGDELQQYERTVDAFVQRLFSTPPFDQLRSAINVHRVDVASNESGAGNRLTGERRATFFGSEFGVNGLDRLLVPNEVLALEVAAEKVPAMNETLMIVNSPQYGGSGGAVAVSSLAPEALDVLLHEMGHSYFGLADEYLFYSDCEDPARARYAGAEPPEPNVTADLAHLKWSSLVTPGVPLPTARNTGCAQCDPAPPEGVPPGVTGAFEGGQYYRCGIYRPAFNCKMRQTNEPFCAVCQAAIRRTLEPYLPKRRRASRS